MTAPATVPSPPMINVASSNALPIVELVGVSMHYQLRRTSLRQPPPTLKAVDKVSLKICAGKTVGVVCESGCG